MIKQSLLLASVATWAFAPSHALAQDQTPEPSLSDDQTDEPETNTDDDNVIVVTGLKRDQAFVDVPVSVQVFGEELIEDAGITRPEDFLALTPNVAFQTSNNAGEFFINIRGQTSVRQSEGAVAIVIDGVQLATQNEFNGELFDIEQIEILKGPQGALYGRNAAAGALIIRTKEPTDTFEGMVRGRYGNWNSAKLDASVGGPIIPGSLRFRLSGSIRDTDGPYQNIATGENVMRATEQIGRFRMIWDDGGPTTVDFRLNGSEFEGGAIAFNAQVIGSTQGGVPVTEIDTDDTSLPFTADVPGDNLQTKYSSAIKIDHDFEWATFTSVSSYSRIIDRYQAKNFPYGSFSFPGNEFVSDALSPGLDLNILAAFGDNTQRFRIDNEAFIQEFRLTSPGDQRLRWQIGFFYLNSDRDFTTEQGLNGRLQTDAMGNLLPPFVIQGTTIGAPVAPVERLLIGGGAILPTRGIDGPETSNGTLNFDMNSFGAENFAPFGNIQYDITDDIEFQVALRYDIENRDVTTLTPDIPNPFFGIAPGAPAATYNLCVANTGRTADECFEDRTFRQLQPKVTLTYKFPSGNGSVFANYGRSFKSGGFNPIGTRAVLVQGLPDILVEDSYDKEVSDSFEIGFKSQFLNRRITVNGAVFYTEVENAQQFEFFPTGGIQAISQIAQTEIFGAEIDINARVTDSLTLFAGAGFIDDEITDIDSQDPADRADIIGNRIPFVPDYNINAGFQLNQPISDNLELIARGEYTRTGTIWYDQRNAVNTERSPIDLVNARLGIGNDTLEFALWSRNLFDEDYNSDAVVILPVAHAVFRAPDRSYGVEARYKF
ncbi:TonB-dependent receptor [Erythrobacter rubeus]|uniref:TonB-dependent receptor n=1 Tax=Erythrobacter rubeus TaxID=2760803 RepID=A0ABR8KWN9_9SPHN|nr:TonB-dependent receptor [Erythrobacter rubeus]MBD2842621.1 TonB-dependent receptor [Erythrobacter rubeus]